MTKRLALAHWCERNFGGIAAGKAASESTTIFAVFRLGHRRFSPSLHFPNKRQHYSRVRPSLLVPNVKPRPSSEIFHFLVQKLAHIKNLPYLCSRKGFQTIARQILDVKWDDIMKFSVCFI